MFEPRYYRNELNSDRLASFEACHLETDLRISVDKASFKEEMKEFVMLKILQYRSELVKYIARHPEFLTSFTPVNTDYSAPEIACDMAEAAHKAGTGPMAAVAGAFSDYIGKALERQFKAEEVIVENGGDIYLNIKKRTVISVYAGNSPLSSKIGIVIKPEMSPLGICTSAGTVGHSFSFGTSDAAVIVSQNTSDADAFATACGNMIKGENDIPKVLEEMIKNEYILGMLLIKGETAGAAGTLELTGL
jgi:uncharacterized protein